jgi:hypothetical protein
MIGFQYFSGALADDDAGAMVFNGATEWRPALAAKNSA